MQVFIENEAGSNQKNLYNEKTLVYRKTVTVSREYPYPYGFILDTTSGDGDNLDCFIITDAKLEAGQVYECEPLGLMEQIESAWSSEKGNELKNDHNILACLNTESIEVTEVVAIEGTGTNSSAGLIGVISKSESYSDIAFSQQTGEPKVVFTEQTGLVRIVPVERIYEIIDSIIKSTIPIQEAKVEDASSEMKE